MNAEITPFSIPLETPLETSDGAIERRSGFLVRVDGGADEDANTAVGVGEATPLPGWTESRSACRSALDSAVERLVDVGPSAALDELDDATPAARHGLSLALADLAARRADRPLYRELGATEPVQCVPVNATIGDGSVEVTAASARSAVDAGYETLKAKVGAQPVDADRQRLRAIRRAVGDDVALRVDANGAWDRETAQTALAAFQSASLEYVEQPLAANQLQDLAELRAGPVDVALDESVAETGVEAILDADAADVLVLKPMVLGGADRTVEIARRARDAGLDVVVSTTVDAVVARTTAVHVAAALAPIAPCGLATGDRLASDLALDPAPIERGSMRVPQAGGTGVDLDSLDASRER